MSSAVARPSPMSRCNVHEEPLSGPSPTRANAIRKPAPSAAIRKSQAKARAAPAPAAIPFTAAMTGIGSDVRAVTIGL